MTSGSRPRRRATGVSDNQSSLGQNSSSSARAARRMLAQCNKLQVSFVIAFSKFALGAIFESGSPC